MIYADYAFYKTNWSGKIPEDEYNFIAVQASQQVDYLTFDRIKSDMITERIQFCQCELADYIYQQSINLGLNQKQSAPIKSETVDTYKVEYAVATSTVKTLGEVDIGVVCICQKWLTRPTNLMFAGVEG